MRDASSQFLSRMFAWIGSALPGGKYAQGTALLALGSASGQALLVLGSPLLTRLYGPADFGILAIYAAIVGTVGVIAGLRYEFAIPLPATEGGAANVLIVALAAVAAISMATGLVAVLLRDPIADWAGIPEFAMYLWFLPVSVAISGAYRVLTYWGIRVEHFSGISQSRVCQGLSMVTVQVALGFLLAGSESLLLGYIAGQVTALVVLILHLRKRAPVRLSAVSLIRVIGRARRYKNFPIYSSGGALVNSFGTNLPTFILGTAFSPTVAGHYMIAERVTKTPLRLLGQAVSEAFMSRAPVTFREGDLGDLLTRTYTGLLKFALAPLVFLAIISPDLFAFVFGAEWRISGEYVRWMVPWLVAIFVFSPLNSLLAVLERQRAGLLFQLILLVVRVLVLLFGWYALDPKGSIAAYAIVSFAVFALFGPWVFMKAGASLKHMLSVGVTELLVLTPLALALVGWSLAVDSLWPNIEKAKLLLIISPAVLAIATFPCVRVASMLRHKLL